MSTARDDGAGGYWMSTEEAATIMEMLAGLTRAGIPLFLAEPDLDEQGRWRRRGGHGRCGYWLPRGWQSFAADPEIVGRWVKDPNQAICMVTGHGVDVVDVDTQADGEATYAQWAQAGMLPYELGRVATPTGGFHVFVNDLNVCSQNSAGPGVDVKAGDRDGHGRGFVFIPGTAKESKLDGELYRYRWVEPINFDELDREDESTRELAGLIESSRAQVRAGAASGVAFVDDSPSPKWEVMPPHEQQAAIAWLEGQWGQAIADVVAAKDWPEGQSDDTGRGWQKLIADLCWRAAQWAAADWSPLTMKQARDRIQESLPPQMAKAVFFDRLWLSQARRGAESPAPFGPVAMEAFVAGAIPADAPSAPSVDVGALAEQMGAVRLEPQPLAPPAAPTATPQAPQPLAGQQQLPQQQLPSLPPPDGPVVVGVPVESGRRLMPWHCAPDEEVCEFDESGKVLWMRSPINPEPPKEAPFPIQALPDELSPMVLEVARNMQVSPSSPASVALGAISAAVRGRVRVAYDEDWSEQAVLNVIVAAETGQKKTPVLERMFRPLRKAEELLLGMHSAAFTESRERIAANEDVLLTLRKQKGKMELPEYEEALRRAIQEGEALEAARPKDPMMFVSDVTSEALEGILHRTGGAVAVAGDEGGIFSTIRGRYTGGQGAFDIYLKGYSGSPIRSSRVTREGVHIARPAVTMMTMVQPPTVADLLGDHELNAKGFNGRQLIAWPDPPESPNPLQHPIDQSVSSRYEGVLRDLAVGCYELEEAVTFNLSAEARARFDEFRLWRIRATQPGGYWRRIQEFANKAEGAVLRLAGLIHACQYGATPGGAPISLDHLERALVLIHWYADELLRHTRGDGEWAPVGSRAEEAALQVAKARVAGRTHIALMEVGEAIFGRGVSSKVVELLEPLSDRGAICFAEMTRKTGGRGRKLALINPLWQP